MAFIALPLGVRLKWSGTIDNRPWSSRVYAIGSLSPTPTILATLAGALVTWSTASWAPVATPNATITEIEAQDWSVHLGAKALATSTAVGSLSGATGSHPSAIAAHVSLLPASGGFRKPGAIFHTAIDLSQTGGTDNLTSGAITAIHALYQALLNDVNAALVPAWNVVMASFRVDKAPRPTGVAFPVTSLVVRPELGTQVRRLRSVR